MELRGRRILVCDCEKTMPLDAEKLRDACHANGASGEIELNTQLCRGQLANFQAAIQGDAPVLVACTQEAPLFAEIADEEQAKGELDFVNIRESAGWAAEAESATPKIAALIAAASEAVAPTRTVSFKSEGVCLVYGSDERAIEAARQLAGSLQVTVLLTSGQGILPPRRMDVPIFQGRIKAAKGHLGGFAITVDGYASALPSSRLELLFEAPRDNAYSECDLILDLTGDAPLFPVHDRRDGYLRPDPDNPALVQKAIFDVAGLVGEFEKPRYVDYDPAICAHARSQKTGCNRCLDHCPVSAITPDGDAVAIDPQVCGGCGLCASVCPTGAVTYALPGGNSLFERLRTLLSAYRAAGGGQPDLLLHDERDGAEMISAMSRGGRGLPASVVPLAVNEVTQVGIDFFALALGYGAHAIAILIPPSHRAELAGLASQMALAETVMEGLGHGGGRIHLIGEEDPDAVEAALFALSPGDAAKPGTFLPLGGKRTRTMLGLRHLHDVAPSPQDILAMPPGAPFGAVNVDKEGCTLCLACVGACPTGALLDDPDRPWLGFNEEACVQCGLCANTCPESVITLEPRLNFTEAAKSTVTLNEAEPFECIRCGTPFGVKPTIERITQQLAGKHPMFMESGRIERMMMCENCRVVAELESDDTPFKAAARPRTHTTEDAFREREIEEARAKVLAERARQGKAEGSDESS